MEFDALIGMTPKLTDGELVTPQPSLEQIVREHYMRVDVMNGGAILADAYLSRLREAFIGSAGARSADSNGPRPASENADDSRTEAPGKSNPSKPEIDPAAALAALGLDLTIGGVSLKDGLAAARDGNAAPLMTGILGMVLGSATPTPKPKR